MVTAKLLDQENYVGLLALLTLCDSTLPLGPLGFKPVTAGRVFVDTVHERYNLPLTEKGAKQSHI